MKKHSNKYYRISIWNIQLWAIFHHQFCDQWCFNLRFCLWDGKECNMNFIQFQQKLLPYQNHSVHITNYNKMIVFFVSAWTYLLSSDGNLISRIIFLILQNKDFAFFKIVFLMIIIYEILYYCELHFQGRYKDLYNVNFCILQFLFEFFISYGYHISSPLNNKWQLIPKNG